MDLTGKIVLIPSQTQMWQNNLPFRSDDRVLALVSEETDEEYEVFIFCINSKYYIKKSKCELHELLETY